MLIDLHIHTDSSDGTWTIDDLMERVIESRIRVFSITDHDTFANSLCLMHRMDSYQEYGFQYFLGVEISSRYKGCEYHITAYSFDPANIDLCDMLEKNRHAREGHNDRLIHSLARVRTKVSLLRYDKYLYNKSRGGWKSLNFLLDEGIIAEVPEYFSLDEAMNAPPLFVDPTTVIEVIGRAGGLCFLAHPSAYGNGSCMSDRELSEWKELGISGLECYSPYCSMQDGIAYAEFCRRNGLLISGGSDCHGEFGDRALGVPAVTPDLIFPSILL